MPMDPRPSRSLDRASAWVRRWQSVLPLLGAEFILWTGFGALLPVMPLYFTQHGVDIALLGVVIAAWPAARLVTEPLFGILADRTARVPLMVVGLLVAAASVGSMAIWTAPIGFVILRATSGLGTALYDPAARGYLNDAAPEGRRGEVFGLYNAAQNGGILLGPALGGLGTALVGSYTFVLALSAVTTLIAAVAVALRVPELRRTGGHAPSSGALAEFPVEVEPSRPDAERGGGGRGGDTGGGRGRVRVPEAPAISLRNRFIAAAILINLAGFFGGGLYETIWGLFVTQRGGGVALIGVTFATFGLVTIVVSPFGGRIVDRRGPLPFVILGLLIMAVMMAAYPFAGPPLIYVPMVAIEAIGFSFLGPAAYAVIARGTPTGRSSTAQGVVGAAGTVGTITASLATGFLAASNLDTPFLVGAVIVVVLLGLTLGVGWGALRSMRPRFVSSGSGG